MKIYFRFCLCILLSLCILIYCIDGYSVGRTRLRRSLSRRIEKNGFDVFSAIKNLKNGYRYISSFLGGQSSDNLPQTRSSTGSKTLSGVDNCDDCFLGMQVSRREAYVVSNSKNWYIIFSYRCYKRKILCFTTWLWFFSFIFIGTGS